MSIFSEDWDSSKTYTTNSSCTTNYSVSSILEAVDKIKKRMPPKPEYDGFAFTYEEWEKISKEFTNDTDKLIQNTIYGIPYWLFATKEECWSHMLDMYFKEGKKIAIINMPAFIPYLISQSICSQPF